MRIGDLPAVFEESQSVPDMKIESYILAPFLNNIATLRGKLCKTAELRTEQG